MLYLLSVLWKLSYYKDRFSFWAYLYWSVRKVCLCGLLEKNAWDRRASLEYKQIENLTNLLK